MSNSIWRGSRVDDLDRQQSVFERVVAEDIGEGGGDDRADAPAGQRPGGMLARGAAAEVIAGQQDLRALVLGLVERQTRVGRAIGQVAPVGETGSCPGRALSVTFRKRAGMIWSVSILLTGSGMTRDVSVVNLAMA